MGKAFPLVFERVSLQPFCEADITGRYLEWLNDQDVVKYSNQRFVEHSAESSLQYLELFAGTDNLFLSIKDNVNQHMLGTITAYIEPRHGVADMGIMIGDKNAWGNGYGLEVWLGLMMYLLDTLKLRKVTGGTASVNYGMIKIMEKSGMHHEASRYKQEIIAGAFVDILCFAKFNDQV